jgi:hypothetical protein
LIECRVRHHECQVVFLTQTTRQISIIGAVDRKLTLEFQSDETRDYENIEWLHLRDLLSYINQR